VEHASLELEVMAEVTKKPKPMTVLEDEGSAFGLALFLDIIVVWTVIRP
jgi:hypothetical protein